MFEFLQSMFDWPDGSIKKIKIPRPARLDAKIPLWFSLPCVKTGKIERLELDDDNLLIANGAPGGAILNQLFKNKNPSQLTQASEKNFRAPAQAETLPPDISDGLGRNQAKRDINSLAQFLKSKARWMVHQNALYIYDNLYWKKLGQDDAIRYIRDICSSIQEFAESLTSSEYKKLYSELLHDPELEVSGELTSPPGIVNFNDGEIDFSDSLLSVRKHNPAHYFMSYIHLSAQEVRNPPMSGSTFERFAHHISGDNAAVRTQLLELLSITLTGVQTKHFYVLLGPSNSGKTQWGRFMEELLGRDQVETVRGIHDFGDRWTVGSLAGKKLATCLDLPDKVLPSAAVGIIKQFCGDDPVKGEVKYANSFTYYQKPLLLFAGNHPIRLANAHREEAFWNRMVAIPFANPVREEDKEVSLYKELLAEAPYIIHEAIIAYQELVARNYSLTRTEIPMEYQQSGVYGYNSVRDFIRYNLEERDGAGVSTKELYEKFCTQTDQDMSLTVFSRALAAAVQDLFPQARKEKRVNKAGDRGYTNLRFISNAQRRLF